jgi:hypothetical protein
MTESWRWRTLSRRLLLVLASTIVSGAILASVHESIMFIHEWNALQIGQPVVDRELNRFQVTAVEPAGSGEPSHLLLASSKSAFWTQNHSGFRKAPATLEDPLDIRQLTVGEFYWLATNTSPLPQRVRCSSLVRTNKGWFLVGGVGRMISEHEILGSFPDGFDGYHSASLAMIGYIEESIREVCGESDE